MTSEWKETTLEDCTSLLGDGLHGTPQYTQNGEYAFVNGNNLVNGRIIIKSDTKRVNRTQFEKYKKELCDRTIMVSINGTLGNVALYNGEKIILGKSACYFNVLESVDKDFIRYVVSSPSFRTYLETNATGTTIKNISLKQMRDYSFYIPGYETQKRISGILRSIDDRISLNTAINENFPPQQGKIFELREHQEEALENLAKMREEGKTIALVQGATGSGKSAIGVLDAKSVGKRTLFLAHTKELVEQGASNFEKLWSEVTVGRFYENFHDTDTQIVCASIQSIIRNLDLFKPDDFDYLIIDECHHASAKSYTTILSYFKPAFTLGLTATPERADGEDLLEVFQNVAHKLDIKDAVEKGVLVPVRCIRVKTNINLADVRINGFKYNSIDLETTVVVPERNQLIVDTYLEYVKNKSTVIFCMSVNHADTIAELLQKNGIKAECVSGKTENIKFIKLINCFNVIKLAFFKKIFK